MRVTVDPQPREGSLSEVNVIGSTVDSGHGQAREVFDDTLVTDQQQIRIVHRTRHGAITPWHRRLLEGSSPGREVLRRAAGTGRRGRDDRRIEGRVGATTCGFSQLSNLVTPIRSAPPLGRLLSMPVRGASSHNSASVVRPRAIRRHCRIGGWRFSLRRQGFRVNQMDLLGLSRGGAGWKQRFDRG